MASRSDAIAEVAAGLRDAVRGGLGVTEPWAAWPAGAHRRCGRSRLAADAATLGLPHALEGFARRLADPLADVLAATLALNHRLGGRNLSEVLDDLATAIHAEAHTLREVQARQDQQRPRPGWSPPPPWSSWWPSARPTPPTWPPSTPPPARPPGAGVGLIVAGYGAMVRLACPPAGTRLLPANPTPGGGRP